MVGQRLHLGELRVALGFGGTQGLGGQQQLGALGGIVGIARGGHAAVIQVLPGLGDAGLQVVEVDFLFVGEVGEGLGRVLDLIRVETVSAAAEHRLKRIAGCALRAIFQINVSHGLSLLPPKRNYGTCNRDLKAPGG